MRKIYLQAAAVALLALIPHLDAQDRSYGRSVVSSPYGIVATSYVQASQAGARGQAVLHDTTTGINYAASDPRADGSAEPEAPPTLPIK